MIEPLLPGPAPYSPAGPDPRFVINGIFFLLRSGAALRTAPPWSTAEFYYSQWQFDGTWDKVVAALQAIRPVRILRPEVHPPPGG